MQAEAAQAKSSGIVGVTVEVKNHVWGEHATEFLATGTAVRRLADEHRLPETTPNPPSPSAWTHDRPAVTPDTRRCARASLVRLSPKRLWWKRVWRLIRCTMMHQNNHEARIHHDKTVDESNLWSI